MKREGDFAKDRPEERLSGEGPAGPSPEAAPREEEGEGYRTAEALLAEKDQELAVLKDRVLRLQAEFDNFKKRQARERAEFLKFGHEGLVREFLAVGDNLERALGSAGDDAQPEAIRTGIEMILRLFRATLEKAGVTLLDCLGKPFDPNLMQAVLQVESPDGVDGQVVEVVQQGYLLEGRVLRPAMVKVSKGVGPREGAEAPAEPQDGGEP